MSGYSFCKVRSQMVFELADMVIVIGGLKTALAVAGLIDRWFRDCPKAPIACQIVSKSILLPHLVLTGSGDQSHNVAHKS